MPFFIGSYLQMTFTVIYLCVTQHSKCNSFSTMVQEKIAPAPFVVVRLTGFMYVQGSFPIIETMDDRHEYKCRFVQSIKPCTWQQGDFEIVYQDATTTQLLEELRAISKQMAA